jgi:hypothetical protein
LLAIFVPISAYVFSFVLLTLARRGQVFSMTAIGRWLLANLSMGLGSGIPGATPMAAELWSDWKLRGRVMPVGAILVATTMCGFFLSGRVAWVSARDAIIALTWLQVMLGPILGLFIGHVGERFDFHEHLATRPLSDRQLADVKLRTALKSVCGTWIAWTIGVAVAVVCLALVGQGPTGWSDVTRGLASDGIPLRPYEYRYQLVVYVMMVPTISWTLTSLGVSVAILRPWLIKTALLVIALVPAIPYMLVYLMPESENEIFDALLLGWIGLTIGGTIVLYAAAFRLRLIATKRVFLVGAMYLLFCVAWLGLAGLLPSHDRRLLPIRTPDILEIGFLLSICALPFVCLAAVPLAIWWNRHR